MGFVLNILAEVLDHPAAMATMWILIGMTAVFAIWYASEMAGQSIDVQTPGALAGAILLGLSAGVLGGLILTRKYSEIGEGWSKIKFV